MSRELPPESGSAESARREPEGAAPSSRRSPKEGPLITYSEKPAGRETLAAIAEAGVEFPRAAQPTRGYGDRISNAPGALSPRLARALDDQPEIIIALSPAGRETHAVIRRELALEPPEIEVEIEPVERRDPPPSARTGRSAEGLGLEALEIEQVLTFVVRAPLALFETESARRELVRTRLLGSLPKGGEASVRQVEVRPWQEPGQLLVRVWCSVS